MNQSAGAYDESDYYTLTLEDESEVDILVPYSISKGMVRNLRDEREHDIFASIYALAYIIEIFIIYYCYIQETLCKSKCFFNFKVILNLRPFTK